MNRIPYIIFFSFLNLFYFSHAIAQTVEQQQIKQLAFLTGKWNGTSKSYEKEKIVREVAATEEIQFKLDSCIITIDLRSESLQLHTVINYSKKDKTYYYHPFYQTGNAKYPAKLVNNQLIVQASPSKRFIFHRLEGGRFQEYGEELIDGEWVKYFEDTFKQ